MTPIPRSLRLETNLAQAGRSDREATGAISCPIYQTATFRHSGLGQSTGYDYSRSSNPTRASLESAIAWAEGGQAGFAFASGMAAVAATLMLLRAGDHLVVSEDLYGGTYRLLEQVLANFHILASYVDTSDIRAVEAAILSNTKALFVETPSNPTLRISDLRGLAALASNYGLLSIADNTFMTPYLQKPLDLGWDIVIHSATKYLGGHNDLVAGLVVTRRDDLGERIGFLQNAAGAILGPMDSWLLLRSLKTLAVRIERQQQNAILIAGWLSSHPGVENVYYPGLAGHPGCELHNSQATGPGAMVSFLVKDARLVTQVLERVNVISFAESLGEVESLITFPALQTHADIPAAVRERLGVTDRLLRLSVGIEAGQDLLDDLGQALDG